MKRFILTWLIAIIAVYLITFTIESFGMYHATIIILSTIVTKITIKDLFD